MRRGAPGLFEIFSLIAIVLFVASVVLAVAVFLYQQFLQTESASKLDQLQRAKAAFEPALIQQLTRLDDRMQSADTILSTHLAPSTFFNILSQVTLTTISFQSLAFDASDPKQIKIKMSGLAQSVNSIALQADLFSKTNLITSPIFSSIGRQPDGVHFNLDALVSPSAMTYAQLIQGPQTVGAAFPTTPSASSSSPFDRGAQSGASGAGSKTTQ